MRLQSFHDVQFPLKASEFVFRVVILSPNHKKTPTVWYTAQETNSKLKKRIDFVDKQQKLDAIAYMAAIRRKLPKYEAVPSD